MLNSVVKVGNILEDIKRFYKSLDEDKIKKRRDLVGDPIYWLSGSAVKEAIKAVAKLEDKMLSLIPKKEYNDYYRSSWCGISERGNCTEWHLDGEQFDNGEQKMLIAAYPNPTEILLNPSKRIDWEDADCDTDVPMRKPKILIPKLGDVYLLDGDVVHRTNRKDLDKFHLVMRIYIHPTKESNA